MGWWWATYSQAFTPISIFSINPVKEKIEITPRPIAIDCRHNPTHTQTMAAYNIVFSLMDAEGGMDLFTLRFDIPLLYHNFEEVITLMRTFIGILPFEDLYALIIDRVQGIATVELDANLRCRSMSEAQEIIGLSANRNGMFMRIPIAGAWEEIPMRDDQCVNRVIHALYA